MNNPNQFNHFVWSTINELGWWYWWIPIAVGLYMTWQLIQLDAPVTKLGRYARALTWVSIVPSLFTWYFNALGAIAYPLTMIAFSLVITQIQLDCRKRKLAKAFDARMEATYHPRRPVAAAPISHRLLKALVQ